MSEPTRYGAGDHELNDREPVYDRETTPDHIPGWKPFRPSESGPEARVQSDYGYGRLNMSAPRPPMPAQAMREERSFWSRTRDEIRSWFGDRGAEERRTDDLARSHGAETLDAHDDEDDVVWHGESNLPPPR